MTSIIPTLLFSAAAEAFILTLAVPHYLPANPLLWTLLRTTLVNIGIYAIYKVFIYPFLLTPLRHLPSPSGGLPLLGHGLALFTKPPAIDFLKWVTEVPNDGLIYFRAFFYQDRLLVTSPEALAEVLVKKSYDFEKPAPLRKFLRQVLGDGLIIVEGEEHKFQRKHIMPVFQFRHIKNLYPMMFAKAVQLTQGVELEIKESSEGGGKATKVVEINHWANKATMDIIGVAALGRDFNALKNSDDELIQNYEEILEPTAEKVTFFATQIVGPASLVRKLPWGVVKRFEITTSNLKRICQELVRDKKASFKATGKRDLDILSVLIESNDFSDEQLADQMLTFLAAGHETTSSAFTWTTWLLATHPEIQTRLREELHSALPKTPGPETDLATILESLPMLSAVCNETLRLFPTVPITARECVNATTILDQYIPKDTQLILSPWAINRSPTLWGPTAGDFVPERWINLDGKPNKNGGARSNYAQLTFLHGPRSCIGQGFAMAELRCLVAAFVSVFEMEPKTPGMVAIPAGVITTKPRDGMELRLTPVGSW
ncbi:cytochrome P450 monooxygenase FUM15-like [Venturia nashicola]|nr:cytochrome P450 monooxygenase FUM15-like [Venturia nashicola]